ncbi:MAG TPA: GxxExxY protein [Candidatus Methylomirabilis sp.]|nr:GxxExxY protein [Candidatus Methylomirabilis sp.]
MGKTKIVYPELSYRVVGALFDVFNDIGYGHRERIYQRAVANRLRELNIPSKEQLPTNVVFHGLPTGNHYLDFLIDEKLVLELKQGHRIQRIAIDQVNGYLRSTKLALGIIATFMPHGVTFMRLLNLPDFKSIRTHP